MSETRIDAQLIKRILGLNIEKQFQVEGVGLVDSCMENTFLTFLDQRKFVSKLNNNRSVAAVFVREDNMDALRPDILRLIVDDPRWYFYKLVNYFASQIIYSRSKIEATATISSSADIAKNGIKIGKNTLIESNVVIMQGVSIGNDCIIRSGAVIGFEGFEHKRTSKGVISVRHDGEVIIEDGVEIGVNNTIAKGFSYRNTIIGYESKFDALVHFAHGAQCKEHCFLAANAMVSGSVSIGSDVWIGPSASISNMISIGDNAFITIGSVVTNDVEVNEKVSGNFAIPHRKFLRHIIDISE